MTFNKLKNIIKKYIEPSQVNINKPIDFRNDMSNRVNRLNILLSILYQEEEIDSG